MSCSKGPLLDQIHPATATATTTAEPPAANDGDLKRNAFTEAARACTGFDGRQPAGLNGC